MYADGLGLHLRKSADNKIGLRPNAGDAVENPSSDPFGGWSSPAAIEKGTLRVAVPPRDSFTIKLF